ncbi:MAG: hypothetical protein ACR2PR_02835 [Pseudohongiellaceae bacterium]
MKVIEFNDRAITLGDEHGIILRSPGFALATGKTLQLGETAQHQARLHPTSSFNKFWQDLSLESIPHNAAVRHNADLAYAHLKYIAEAAELEGDTVFAVPGNFTRQQLAILLGLAKQTPLKPVGIIDSALATVIGDASGSSIVYADIQLHQVLLSHLIPDGDHLKLQAVVQIPGVGSQDFTEQMMQLATTLFIQQCRFNPQHNAESEQQLCNQLPHWLSDYDDSATAKSENIVLELKTTSQVHTAKLPRESLLQTLRSNYQKIDQHIEALATPATTPTTQLLISPALAALPALSHSLTRTATVLDEPGLSRNCVALAAHIRSADTDAMTLINTLPHTPQTLTNTEKPNTIRH